MTVYSIYFFIVKGHLDMQNWTLQLQQNVFFLVITSVTWPCVFYIDIWHPKCTCLGKLKLLTSSMPGMVFTDSFFKEDCNFLSSVAWVECTTFFFRLGVPLPPILTWATWDCNFFNFSAFMIAASLCDIRSDT